MVISKHFSASDFYSPTFQIGEESARVPNPAERENWLRRHRFACAVGRLVTAHPSESEQLGRRVKSRQIGDCANRVHRRRISTFSARSRQNYGTCTSQRRKRFAHAAGRQ